ncbi:MAG TPA: hypothetical protein VN436_12215 [Holophaga sp.]|nr:hypothetical protein [Holophaga sp.]
MRIIALEHECGSLEPAVQERVLREEARALWELQQAGYVREAYFRADRKEAVLVLEAQGPEQARDVLAGLPLVQQGIIRFEFVPLVPYDGYARLFKA